MKVFIKKTVILLTILMGFFFFVDFLISKGLKKSFTFAEGEFPVWNDLYNGNINSEIVIYGSSRAWVHINPEIISRNTKKTTYNIGVDGSGFRIQYLRHKVLMKYNTKPKYIILSLDIFGFGKREGLYNRYQYLPYMLFNKELEKILLPYEMFSKNEFKYPLIRYFNEEKAIFNGVQNYFVNQDSKIARVRGYQGQPRNWTNDLLNARKEKGYIYSDIYDDDTFRLVKKLIDDCKETKIELILVYTPEQILGHNFVKNRDELLDFYTKLAKDNNLVYFDYSKHPINKRKELFYNSMHLNKKGSDIFSTLLSKQLDSVINKN